MELVKNYSYAGKSAVLSFYRDDNSKEIDVIPNLLGQSDIEKCGLQDIIDRIVKKYIGELL